MCCYPQSFPLRLLPHFKAAEVGNQYSKPLSIVKVEFEGLDIGALWVALPDSDKELLHRSLR